MGVEQAAGALAEARGHAALAAGRAADAIPFFREADRTYASCPRCVMINLARAFDLAGKRDSAIAYSSDSSILLIRIWMRTRTGSPDRTSDSASCMKRRRSSEAVTNLEKFIALWKDADPELHQEFVTRENA
jgi:hypothetical protein